MTTATWFIMYILFVFGCIKVGIEVVLILHLLNFPIPVSCVVTTRNFKFCSSSDIDPNDLTFSFLLKASFKSKDARYVTQKMSYFSDTFVSNGLVAVWFLTQVQLAAELTWSLVMLSLVRVRMFCISSMWWLGRNYVHKIILWSVFYQPVLEKLRQEWVCILSEMIEDCMSHREACHDSINSFSLFVW